jgi:hypothetical protein
MGKKEDKMKKGSLVLFLCFITIVYLYADEASNNFREYQDNIPIKYLSEIGTYIKFNADVTIPPQSDLVYVLNSTFQVKQNSKSRIIKKERVYRISSINIESDIIVIKLIDDNLLSIRYTYNQGVNTYLGVFEIKNSRLFSIGYNVTELEKSFYDSGNLSFNPYTTKSISLLPKGRSGYGVVLDFTPVTINNIPADSITVLYYVLFDANQQAISGLIDWSYYQWPGRTMKYKYYNGGLSGGKIENGFKFILPNGLNGKMEYMDGTLEIGRWKDGVLLPIEM